VLDDAHPEVDPWPALTLWADRDATATHAQVLARRADFKRPNSPRYSFGTSPGVLWLRMPLRLEAPAAGAGSEGWWLRISYPDLDRIDMLLVEGGQVVDHQVMGHELRCRERPVCASAHAAPLRLQPGRDYELLVGVRTASEQVVPLSLLRGDRFAAVERQVHLMAGLELGFSFAVLLYAFSHWVTMRRPEFGLISLMVAGVGWSFLCQNGVGEHLLWPDNLWMMREGGLMAGMLSLAAACLLLDRVLDGPRVHRLGSWLLRGAALFSPPYVLMRMVGVIDFETANLVLGVLVLVPLVVGTALAWMRARRGDKQARLVMAERLLQGGATLVFIGLIQGWLPANFWTQQSFVIAALGTFVVYCTIIVQRVEAVRAATLQARRRQEQLVVQAQIDALTGLPNRRSLHTLLEQALPVCSAQRPLALYLIDLDGFKPINDVHGHAVGDELLVAFSQRLCRLVRSGDVVARLGGDEFVVLAPVADADAAQRLGQALLGSCVEVYELGGLRCRVGLTIGWVLCLQPAAAAAAVLEQADDALYAGKRRGRGCLVQAGAALEPAGETRLQPRTGPQVPA
ncbi:MAG TPA: diguanylate cyclase, partial [Burkholderiaceae bacterium]|nr:diguanylate cyclase [Burkholderiaceae bacterium]